MLDIEEEKREDIPTDKQMYNTLICNYPKYPVNENLNGTVAFYENDKKTDCLLISMKEKQTNLKHSYNYFGGKKSSSGGLSGGAIAGIVIASVAALCAVVFSFILCKAPTKPPSSNVNTIEMVSSTTVKPFGVPPPSKKLLISFLAVRWSSSPLGKNVLAL